MKQFKLFLYTIFLVLFMLNTGQAMAQKLPISEKLSLNLSSESSSSSRSSSATISAITVKEIKKTFDITQPEPEVKDKLEKLLEENPVNRIGPFNVVRHAIRFAVSEGVPANTLVLILLFPLIAAVVVFSRHIIGLKSFGIFTPALLAVAFLSTGVVVGTILFVFILIMASVLRALLKRVRIQYLPRMAIMMLFISLSIFVFLLISPIIGNESLITIGIFPILILILTAEEYLDIQITQSTARAMAITLETMVLAIACYFLMDWVVLQKFVLVNPELFILLLLGSIVLIDQYSGLRILEIWRFRKLIK